MKMKLIAFLGIIVILFAACSNTTRDKNPDIDTSLATPVSTATTEPPIKTLPSFQLTSVDGKTINLADLKGKKVFVNLWATWCPPCRAEIPSIEKLSKKTPDVAYVMLSLDQNFALAKAYAKANKMSLPVYYPAGNLPDMFNTEGIPATFIFNENGELIKANMGAENYDTKKYVDLLGS
ncbi:MAG: TlpA family protein disulfide reductase [Ginsengibacter sp.]